MSPKHPHPPNMLFPVFSSILSFLALLIKKTIPAPIIKKMTIVTCDPNNFNIITSI